ncbi:MAG: rhomboid family intramembrane serine protease [Candidatus Obscuribacterales bacterium]|nr:rhomboid family intramembrane serine protease [Candidatus Obscuribacterales bacterium]
MTSQFTLWLYPILLLSAVSVIFRLRLPIKWSWPFIVQSIPLILCGVLGLTIGPDWMFAIIGWSLVFIFYVPPKLFYSGLQRNLTGLNADELRRAGKSITLVFWGLSGEFWKDMCEALALFVEMKPEPAEALLHKWQGRDGLPKAVAQIPNTYRLVGTGVMWRWQDIIANYERVKESDHVPSSLYTAAARAYAEEGRFTEAAQCLKAARVPEANLPLFSLAILMLPFFGLIGARRETDELLAILAEKNKEFPEYARYYWKGRCEWADNDLTAAQATLLKADQISSSPLFRARIELQLEKVKRGEPSSAAGYDEATRAALSKEIWAIFSRAAFVQEIISPRRKSIAVGVLIVVISIFLLITDSYEITKIVAPGSPIDAFARMLSNTVFQCGALIPQLALKGEYWRFISYLFLHAHITHAALNLIGLYWFGRVAENIFGTSRFLAIYIVGGLLSGVAHAVLSPDQNAVGASGAVMAIFGAVGAGIFRLKDKIPESIWRFHVSWLAGLALSQLVLDHVIPHVAAFAHLGGLLAGLAIGMLLSIRTPSLHEVDGTQKFVGG